MLESRVHAASFLTSKFPYAISILLQADKTWDLFTWTKVEILLSTVLIFSSISEIDFAIFIHAWAGVPE